MPQADFWQGKRVLLTGHTGFKGGWLALWLQQMGAKVTGVALEPESELGIYRSAHIESLMTSHICDIRSAESFQAIIGRANPEIVFHLAAQPLVRQAHAFPVETFETNMMGTVHLFEGLKKLQNLQAVIVVTSDKVYENHDTGQDYVEDDRLGGKEAYGTSKACCELITNAYRHMLPEAGNKAGIATVRAGNVIGGGDWAADRLFPDAIRSFTGNQPFVIRNPLSTRPWQHVLMPLDGYIRLAEKLAADPKDWQGAWNFGPSPEDAIPVEQVANRIVDLWNADGESKACWQQDAGHHPYEAKLLSVDCSKAINILGWQPAWNVTRGLKETIDWYKAQQEGQDMQAFSLGQINSLSR